MAIGGRTASEHSAYALLTDGTTVQIRAARQEDYGTVRDMHASMSADNLYLRFFTVSKLAPDSEARRICREPAPDHAALLAVLDGEVIGCGSFERSVDYPGSAEVALTVADDMHRRGVGTLLLEHLVSLARSWGIRVFTAQTLTENTPMLHVFADAGLPVRRALADGVYDFSFPLPCGEAGVALGAYRDAVAGRERSSGVASLRHALVPASVAVIGASQDPRSAGAAVLRNIVAGGFGGPVYVISPGLAELDGTPCLPSVAALPDQVDLAVISARPPRCPASPKSAGDGESGPWPSSPAGWTARPGRSWSASAGATACGWSGRARPGWPTPVFPSTPPSGPGIPGQGWQAWHCSPVRARSSCWSSCPGSGSASHPLSRSATRTTYPATTCCSGGHPTR
jgi:GNAT superfamily N-acetyltransferase